MFAMLALAGTERDLFVKQIQDPRKICFASAEGERFERPKTTADQFGEQLEGERKRTGHAVRLTAHVSFYSSHTASAIGRRGTQPRRWAEITILAIFDAVALLYAYSRG